ncbi:hypothetical protein F511_33473 [Dorcoceras hygrometricum]|uniref:Uncharacterized protein n=1 Tax=Dorcoceras hygrometricum TaxID=472368 RepID=A0A2Z7DD91_9LAMI|nr:hypothetical protein F511_33473 [Dorcoceras hygrometricum]
MSTINTTVQPATLHPAPYCSLPALNENYRAKGSADSSNYTPDPSSVERAHGSSAAHSPFLWGPSLLS